MHRGRGRRSGTGSARSRSGGRGECSHFNISKDGSEFHFCHPDKMKVEIDLLKNYKSSLKCVGGYSEDDEQNFWNDRTQLSFLNTDFLPQEDSKEKTVNLDLNTAKEEEKPYSGTLMKSSENFFSWIISNTENLTETLNYETKFVFLKNILAKLMKIPYGYAVESSFYAVYSNGIVYLLNEKNMDSYALEPQISRWGHKFQQYLTHGENVKEGVICNCDYRCVMTAKLGPHNLLFSASMDCFNPDVCDFESPDPTSSVLLKCCYDNPNNSKTNTFERFKMYEWCVSLSSLNIPHVLVGLRTVDGIVKVLKLFTEDDLSSRGKQYWNIEVGFTYAKNVLSFIEKTTKNKPETVFHFTKPKFKCCIKAEESDMENFPPKWVTEELEEALG